MLRVAAYCRVSTEKEEQLDSLKKQIEYFQDFAGNNGYELVEVYADEGISGKQIKNRTRFLEMLKDADDHKFDLILVKDISRFARNTLDFLDALRRLKSINVDIRFVNNSQTAIEGSEFMLTMLAAIAQEESAKLSERIKWGKNITAKKGRVPNIVFGYDKVDIYTLAINQSESEVVRKMYYLLINEGYGTGKIAEYLNKSGIPAKKKGQSGWHQKTVIEILRNPIYTGKIINKKSEVADFITGTRRRLEKEKQLVVDKPEIRIISDDTYHKAMKTLGERREAFKLNRKRESTKHPFSNLIRCSECGYSFRRMVRKYSENGTEYVFWACSLRNAKGKDSCSNKTVVREDYLLQYFIGYLSDILKNNESASKRIAADIYMIMNKQNKSMSKANETYRRELEELEKKKQKYYEMYANEILTMEELKKFNLNLSEKIRKAGFRLGCAHNRQVDRRTIEKAVNEYMDKEKNIEGLLAFENEEFKHIIKNILVFPQDTIEISLKESKNIPKYGNST